MSSGQCLSSSVSVVSFAFPPALLCHTLLCGCPCVILFFGGLTANNFNFCLSFDSRCDISYRVLLFLLSTSRYCVFIFFSYIFSSILMYIFLFFFSFFLSLGGRKRPFCSWGLQRGFTYSSASQTVWAWHWFSGSCYHHQVSSGAPFPSPFSIH